MTTSAKTPSISPEVGKDAAAGDPGQSPHLGVSGAAGARSPSAEFLSSGAAAYDGLLGPVIARVLHADHEFRHWGQTIPSRRDAQVDYIFATANQEHEPEEIFPLLRWGGQFVFASKRRADVQDLCRRFVAYGFAVERAPDYVRRPWTFLPIWRSKVHHFVVRKVQLIAPGQTTDRFTYNVHLERDPRDHQYIVCKQVPTLESMIVRLKKRWPDLTDEMLEEKRARKFTDKIFPTFLTREAAILKILQDHLPAAYARRVPHVIGLEKDIRGYVRTLRMNWLRNGGRPLSQIEFAMQSADLLRAVHDSAGIIHLDLRLDNFVITPDGVGFVDFGSSVRMDENLRENPLLSSIFDELMKTSQIQRMLAKMTHSGHVTSEVLCRGQGKVDKAVDVFYLAVQFNSPCSNPDLHGLINYERSSREAIAISQFTERVLKPLDPKNPAIQTAKDILRELEVIEQRLKGAV